YDAKVNWKVNRHDTIPAFTIDRTIYKFSFTEWKHISIKAQRNAFDHPAWITVNVIQCLYVGLLSIYKIHFAIKLLKEHYKGLKRFSVPIKTCYLELIDSVLYLLYCIDPIGIRHLLPYPVTLLVLGSGLVTCFIPVYILSQ